MCGVMCGVRVCHVRVICMHICMRAVAYTHILTQPLYVQFLMEVFGISSDEARDHLTTRGDLTKAAKNIHREELARERALTMRENEDDWANVSRKESSGAVPPKLKRSSSLEKSLSSPARTPTRARPKIIKSLSQELLRSPSLSNVCHSGVLRVSSNDHEPLQSSIAKVVGNRTPHKLHNSKGSRYTLHLPSVHVYSMLNQYFAPLNVCQQQASSAPQRSQSTRRAHVSFCNGMCRYLFSMCRQFSNVSIAIGPRVSLTWTH